MWSPPWRGHTDLGAMGELNEAQLAIVQTPEDYLQQVLGRHEFEIPQTRDTLIRAAEFAVRFRGLSGVARYYHVPLVGRKNGRRFTQSTLVIGPVGGKPGLWAVIPGEP